MMASLAEHLNKDKKTIIELYNVAHKEDVSRGEPIRALIAYLQRIKDWDQSYVYSSYGLRYIDKDPYPKKILFIDKPLYQYKMLELHAVSCFHTKRINEGSTTYWKLRHKLATEHIQIDKESVKIILENEKYFPRIDTFDKKTFTGTNYTPPKKKRKK